MGSFGNDVIILILLVLAIFSQASDAVCPPPQTVSPTGKVCISDKECYPGRCCVSYQGPQRKYCAREVSGIQGASGNKGSGGNGVNCNGVKCSPFEVCKPDPITKRLRCQRA